MSTTSVFVYLAWQAVQLVISKTLDTQKETKPNEHVYNPAMMDCAWRLRSWVLSVDAAASNSPHLAEKCWKKIKIILLINKVNNKIIFPNYFRFCKMFPICRSTRRKLQSSTLLNKFHCPVLEKTSYNVGSKRKWASRDYELFLSFGLYQEMYIGWVVHNKLTDCHITDGQNQYYLAWYLRDQSEEKGKRFNLISLWPVHVPNWLDKRYPIC